MKARGIRVVAQQHGWDCGIASLAMLFGLRYRVVRDAAIELWGSTMPSRRGIGIYHLEQLGEALGRPLKRVYRRDGYLTGQTGILGLNGGQMCWAGHWVVLRAGAVIDPDGAEVWALADYLKAHRTRAATLIVEKS